MAGSTVHRRAAIRSHGVFSRYPYQVNTHGLPPAVIAENVLGFIAAQLGESGAALRERVPRDFAEFVLRHLGEGLARNFMFPYNEKLWTVPPAELTIEWMGRFVPRPTLEQVVRGALGLEGDAEGYNATFLYPREGGIETFVRALVAGFLALRSAAYVRYPSIPSGRWRSSPPARRSATVP